MSHAVTPGSMLCRFNTRNLPVCVVALMCLVLSGCKTPEHAYPPPSDALRARFGNMALRLQPSTSAFSYELPATKGVGAGRGAKLGAGSGLAIIGVLGSGAQGSGDGALYATVVIIGLGVATALVAAPVGAIVGALEGVPADRLRSAETNVGSILIQTDVGLVLREDLLDAAWAHANRPLVTVDELFPLPPGVQTVIELELSYACLGQPGSEDINPPMALELRAFARVVDPAADEHLYSYQSRFKSSVKRKFTAWAKDDARALRKEFEVGCQALAKDIVAQLFLRPAVVDTGNEHPRPGTNKDVH